MMKILKRVSLIVVLALVLSVGALVLPVVALSENGVDFSATPTSGNAPLSVHFENLSDILFASSGLALADNGYTWLWDFGDGGTSTEECPTHVYQCAGVYDVSLTMGFENGPEAPLAVNGGWTETKYGYITVYPVAGFTASPTMGQAPLTVYFSDLSTGCPQSWYWSFGDGGSSYMQNPVYTYTRGGSYTVTLTVSGSPSSTVTKLAFIIVEEGTEAPSLVVRNLNLSAAQSQPGQGVGVTADVFNEGGAWGSDTVDLIINGQFEQSQGVGVAPGTAQRISFTVYKTTPGEYQVQVGNAMGTFYVVEAASADRTTGGIPLGTGGIIAFIVIGVIVVAGLIVAIVVIKPS